MAALPVPVKRNHSWAHEQFRRHPDWRGATSDFSKRRIEMKRYVRSWTRGTGFAALLMLLTVTAVAAQDTISVASPDGRNRVGVGVNDGKLYYILSRDGSPLLRPSMLGFEFKGAPTLRDGLRIVGTRRATHDETW